MRTAITLTGIAIGVASIVALSAASGGLLETYGALSGGSNADLTVVQEDAIDIVFSSVEEDLGPALASMPGVRDVTGMVYTFAAAPSEGMPYFIVFGYDPGAFVIDHFRVVEGEGLQGTGSRRGGRPILLGRAVADDLDKSVGDTIRLYESTFRIVGIYETGVPIEDSAAVVTIADAQTLSKKPRQVNAFLIKLRSLDDAELVRGRLEQRYDDLTVTLSSDFADDQEMLLYIDGFVWAISFLAVVMGGIVVMNTLLMSIFERTSEFGALRAVGWRPARVMGLVMGEALALCGLGGVLGSLLGAGLVGLLNRTPVLGGFFNSTYSPGLFVRGIGVALALGTVGGLYPAWRASRLAPAEAMRVEGSAGARNVRFRWTVLRNLLRQPTRTLLTWGGIGMAIMTLVSLGGLAAGMADAMTGVASNSAMQLAGMEADASIDLSTIDAGIVTRIASMPGVESAEGFLTGYATVGEAPFFIVFGYQPRGQLVRDFRIVEGETLTANRQIIVGRAAARNLDLQVGQSFRIFDSSFRVVGIYETGVPFEDGGGVIALRDAQNLFGQPHKVSFLGVRVSDPRQAESIADEIEARFPSVSISLASEFAENVGDLQMMEEGIWGIAFLALLVGGAGMMNTMVMSVFERTREVGVLRALGWDKGRVLSMILTESLALSLSGGIVGAMMGVVGITGLNMVPAMASFVKARFSLEVLIQALVTALVLGVIGGIYPAWRASRLQPVEALRYE